MATVLTADLEASLRRLGWRELDERLGGTREDDPCRDRCPSCGEGARTEPPPPSELRSARGRLLDGILSRSPEATRVELTREVAVWPGDVLADLTGERFYPAAGLAPEELATLQGRTPTLGELCRRHGRPWVEFHVLRLWVLGLVHLRGSLPA